VSALVVLGPKVETQSRTDQTRQSRKQFVQEILCLFVIAMSGVKGEADDDKKRSDQPERDGSSH